MEAFNSNSETQKSLKGNSGSIGALKAAGITKFRPLHRSSKKTKNVMQKSSKKAKEDPRGAKRWYIITLDKGANPLEVLERLQEDPQVERAEVNHPITLYATPNDPDFSELWGLHNIGQTDGVIDADIDATEAWDIQQGNESVLIAVIDTGVDYTHPDLAANIWVNPGEIPGNGIDDDENGFVDDVHGYDFFNDVGEPYDDHGHGTHVSGTIAAVGNNGIGVTGVNWQARIMAVKIMDGDGRIDSGSLGDGTEAGAAQAIIYAADNGARIMNNSWGATQLAGAIEDAIAYAEAADSLFVAAAGNYGTDNDAAPPYPCSYDLPNIISVAATDHNDDLASFSCFGANSVDIGAPGVNILSTTPNNTYSIFNGTSMASPHVAGAAGLLLAQDNTLSAIELRALLSHGDFIPSLAGITTTGRRLNINNALLCDSSELQFLLAKPGGNFEARYDAYFDITYPFSISGYLYSCGSSIIGGTVSVSFDNGEPNLVLYDDGLHDDGNADDGLYANTWEPGTLGDVTLDITAMASGFSDPGLASVSGLVYENMDVDEDGLENALEDNIGTDPFNPDTDGDTLPDGIEVCFDGDCSVYLSGVDLNPLATDTDNDGFDDGLEYDYAGDGLDPAVKPWQDNIVASQAEFKVSCATALQDVDGDDITDFAVSLTNGTGQTGGSLQIYSGKTQSLLYTIAAPADVFFFGEDCSDAGDMNGDGVHDIVVTSGLETNSLTYSLMVFSGVDGSSINRWDMSTTVTSSAIHVVLPKVAGGTDFNGDLTPDIVVATRSMDKIEIISGVDGSLITRFDAQGSDVIGRSLAIAGDMDGGGLPDIVVGGAEPISFPFSYGRVLIYSAETGQELLSRTAENELDMIGHDVDGIGDLNSDGVPDFLTSGWSAIIPTRPDATGRSAGVGMALSGADGTTIFEWRQHQDYDAFGAQISKVNLGNDTIPDIMILAPWGFRFDDFGDVMNSELYVFSGVDGSQAIRFHLQRPGTAGRAVHNLNTLGDINADNIDDILFIRGGRTEVEIHVLMSPGVPAPAPEISSFSPNPASIGSYVYLYGSGFCLDNCNQTGSPDLSIYVGDVMAETLYVMDGFAYFVVPEGATTAPIRIEAPGGEALSEGPLYIPELPIVHGVSPASGPVGLHVTITGENFCYPYQFRGEVLSSCDTWPPQVTVNDMDANIVSSSFDAIEFEIPSGAQSGPVVLTIDTWSDGIFSETVGEFTVEASLPPTISLISSMTAEPGEYVYLNGSNFCLNECGSTNSVETTISIGSVTVSPASVVPNFMYFIVPEGAVTGPITITNPWGEVTSDTVLNIVVDPVFTGMTPEQGPEGTHATISGENFCYPYKFRGSIYSSCEYSPPQVTVNGMDANVVSSSFDAIEFEIPPGAQSGSVVLTITPWNDTFSETVGDFTVE